MNMFGHEFLTCALDIVHVLIIRVNRISVITIWIKTDGESDLKKTLFPISEW